MFWCNFLSSTGLELLANDNFLGTFIDFRFTKVLMKELAGNLIPVRKIFNSRVSLKILLPLCFINVQKELGP